MFLVAVAERYNYLTSSIVTRAGEYVISLEDMVWLTGLRVPGRPVTGRVRSDYAIMMRELVGSRVVLLGPDLLVTFSTVHRVEDSLETMTESGADAD